MADRIWRARDYSDGMFRWILTGDLPEGSAGAVVLAHLKQTALYCALTLLSANLLSLMLGSALLNTMNFYVAQLMRRSGNAAKALICGWNPWSIIRVSAFLWLGVVLSAPALHWAGKGTGAVSIAALSAGVAGILVDLALKLGLSRPWSRLLKGMTREDKR